MNKLYVGRVVGTHGIKGEIKISSDIEIDDKVFKIGNILYFDDASSFKINSVRIHKGNYLVLLEGFNNINDVLFLSKRRVYINRDDVLDENDYVLDDLIGFEVIFDGKTYGFIKDYERNSSYAIFLVEGDKTFYLPNVPEYVINIDLNNKKVYTKNIGDLILWKLMC